MGLLTRIAYSKGDPERTIEALRLVVENLQREMDQRPALAEFNLSDKNSMEHMSQPRVNLFN